MSKSKKQKKQPYIQVSNVNFKYGDNTVLEGITFDVKKGEYLGVIGPNGGGKTTLLKVMLGLLEPHTGTVKIEGEKVQDMKNRAIIGYVPQRVSQMANDFPATVEEIVASGRTPRIGLFNHRTPHDRKKIEWAMDVAEVTSFRKKLISELSGGQRQRVFIARALAGEPEILFLDEPTVAIDYALSKKFYAFMADLNKKLGITILFVSHDIDCVAKEVSSVICVHKTLVCHTSPKDLMKNGHLEKLYGRDVAAIHHHHDHA